jgi:insulin receptor
LKRCQAKIVDSIATAQALKGCSIIDGPLEIQIRGSTKNQDGSNIVKELEASLSSIVEINDYLKIARSHSILSFSFLKNLKRINGKKLESNRNALVVWENQNLQELWDINQKIEIGRGKLFFHFNPKLCFFKIENLANKSSPSTKPKDLIENYDTAKLSNGDKTPCNVTPLNVTVVEILPQAALLSWPPLKLDDDRALLNYVVYYIAAPYNNVIIFFDFFIKF